MTTEAQLAEWKRAWRHLLSESLGRAFDSIEERLPAGSEKADELLLLKAQLNEANRAKVMGVKSSEDLQLDYNRIRLHLLEWIDGLEIADFNTAASGLKPKGRGVLLHKIPRQMEVGREEVCVIRLAYDRAVIADNLELTEEVEVREVKVSEVMEAELIDPNSQPAFNIRTFHDERQFLEEGAYTEWKFYVEPVREGAFRLLIKLTVIEEVMGARERRNIAWEEQVQIVSEAHEPVPATFTASGISLVSAEETTSGAPEPQSVLPGTPPSPAPMRDRKQLTPSNEKAAPASPPQLQAKKKNGLIRGLSIVASVVLILGFGSTYFLFPDKHVETEQSENIQNPDDRVSIEAKPKRPQNSDSVNAKPRHIELDPGLIADLKLEDTKGNSTSSPSKPGSQIGQGDPDSPAKPSNSPVEVPEGVRFSGAIADRELDNYKRLSEGMEMGIIRLNLCASPSGEVVRV